jgi:hypothetical protein
VAAQRKPRKSAADRYADNQARADALLAKGDDASLAERDRLLAENEAHERGEQEEPAPDPAPSATASTSTGNAGDSMRWKGGGTQLSAIVLGFFAWVWVVLPAIKTDPTSKAPGGATAVRNMLKAKFLNLGADGQPL